MNLVRRRSGVIPLVVALCQQIAPILNSDRGIRTASPPRTIRCQLNGEFRVTYHLTTVDRPMNKGRCPSWPQERGERAMRFRGFNSVSTDPGSFAYARGYG